MKLHRRNFALLCLAPLVLMLVGCPSWERSAFQSLAASKATLDSAQQAYEVSASTGTCASVAVTTPCIPHTQVAHDAIEKAKALDKTAVDALVTYETAKANGAGQAALQQAQTDVETTLAALPGLISDVKALYVKGGK